jgi:hypothetical protein
MKKQSNDTKCSRKDVISEDEEIVCFFLRETLYKKSFEILL